MHLCVCVSITTYGTHVHTYTVLPKYSTIFPFGYCCCSLLMYSTLFKATKCVTPKRFVKWLNLMISTKWVLDWIFDFVRFSSILIYMRSFFHHHHLHLLVRLFNVFIDGNYLSDLDDILYAVQYTFIYIHPHECTVRISLGCVFFA